MSNPADSTPAIPDPAEEIAVAFAELELLNSQAEALAVAARHHDTSNLAAVPGQALPAKQMKTVLATAHNDLVRMRATIEQKSKELERKLDAQMQRARQMLAPLQKQMALLVEGIQTINLYLGSDEEIVTLRSGEPAPPDTPITVRQMILAMDEETAIAADDGGIDARNIDEFDAWLLADEAHLHQVFPEPKGVVVLMARREWRDYGDPWTTNQRNAENRHSYWLIRNGDNLYRMDTDFNAGSRLIPTRDEFTSFFETDRWGRTIQPGTREWADAEERADARKRHYMKAALILQGLIDRTTVFQPLPAAAVSLLSPESYDAGHVVVVCDAEAAIGTGREPFTDWLRRLNNELSVGMRIIGAFNSQEWRNVDEYGDKQRWGHSRLTPKQTNAPSSTELHLLEGRRDGGFLFRFKRSDKRYGYEHGDWGRWGEWEYENRASCVIRASDRFVIPFDLVTVAEMQEYLDSRTERHAYAAMFPVLKAAIAAKRAEEAQEAPFRLLLAGQMASANGVPVAEAMDAVADLVDWWKYANRNHRPLLDDDAAALTGIVAEHARRLKTAAKPIAAATVERLLTAHPEALIVARKTDGTIVVLDPERPTGVFGANVFVAEHTYNAKGDRLVSTKHWKTTGARFTRLAAVHTSQRWAQWEHNASLSDHLTDPEAAQAADAVACAAREAQRRLIAIEHAPARGCFYAWELTELPSFDAEHPLTGDHRSLNIRRVGVTWSRTVGQRLEVGSLGNWGERYVPEYWPWVADARSNTRDPHAALVTLDRELLAEIDKAQADYRRMSKLAEPLGQQVSGWVDGLKSTWHDARLAEAKERFHADFGPADDLWEGHLKALRLPPFPDHHHFGKSDLHHIAALVVEAGHRIERMSVREVVGLYAGLPDDERAVRLDVFPESVHDLRGPQR